MKKTIALLKMTILFCCLMSGTVFGVARDMKIQAMHEKAYIDPQKIHFVDNNIIVSLNNSWGTTNALYADSQGVYIQPDSFLGFWTCSNCGNMNPPYYLVCHRCKNPR